MTLWGGRFLNLPAEQAAKFTHSIAFDSRLAKYDVLGSIAHVKMLGKCRIIPKKDAGKIVSALDKLLKKILRNEFKADQTCEDIHSNIEKEVIKLAGQSGKMMHTARSRNDQIALDERMYLRDEINNIINLLTELINVFKNISKKSGGEDIPGFTHMQHAQPVKFADYLGAYISMFSRDIERLKDCNKRVNVMPLGACALNGTSFPIDRKFTAKLLKFPKLTSNNMDAVSDRDFVAEFLSCNAVLFVHLSRLSEEMVIWSTKEFGYIEIADEFTTGSSIMPQKKNPDIFELTRGKAGRAFSALFGLLTIMKGLPLAYNSDMQEDKVHLFSGVDAAKDCLGIMIMVLSNITLKPENIDRAMDMDFSDATEIANYLAKKGLPFRDAHKITGRVVLYCINCKKNIKEMGINEFKKFSKLFQGDVFKIWKNTKKK
jgi:argininosuccinate lyase